MRRLKGIAKNGALTPWLITPERNQQSVPAVSLFDLLEWTYAMRLGLCMLIKSIDTNKTPSVNQLCSKESLIVSGSNHVVTTLCPKSN